MYGYIELVYAIKSSNIDQRVHLDLHPGSDNSSSIECGGKYGQGLFWDMWGNNGQWAKSSKFLETL